MTSADIVGELGKQELVKKEKEDKKKAKLEKRSTVKSKQPITKSKNWNDIWLFVFEFDLILKMNITQVLDKNKIKKILIQYWKRATQKRMAAIPHEP